MIEYLRALLLSLLICTLGLLLLKLAFFFNDTATTEIYTLSLHDALPISPETAEAFARARVLGANLGDPVRSEEHTSELQSPCNLVCRLLLEKKNPGGQDAAGLRTARLLRPQHRAEPVARQEGH